MSPCELRSCDPRSMMPKTRCCDWKIHPQDIGIAWLGSGGSSKKSPKTVRLECVCVCVAFEGDPRWPIKFDSM